MVDNALQNVLVKILTEIQINNELSDETKKDIINNIIEASKNDTLHEYLESCDYISNEAKVEFLVVFLCLSNYGITKLLKFYLSSKLMSDENKINFIKKLLHTRDSDGNITQIQASFILSILNLFTNSTHDSLAEYFSDESISNEEKINSVNKLLKSTDIN